MARSLFEAQVLAQAATARRPRGKKRAGGAIPMTEDPKPETGPRGGTTTVTSSGLVKKNLWIPARDAERLRRVAYELRTSEADIVRQGLSLILEELE